MIRKLNENDLQPLMELVGKNPAINLFIIGDVENFGFNQDFQELWGEYDSPGGPLKAVMLRYFGNYLPYAEGTFDTAGFAEIIRMNTAAEMISGASGVVQAFRGKVSIRNEKEMHFAQLSEMNEEIRRTAAAATKIKKAAAEDVEAVCSLMDIIEEFEGSPEDSRRSYHQTLESGTGRTYFAEQDGKVIAAASTAAENSLSAMIIGVATHPLYRGRGLATRVVAQLCTDIIADGKSLCLFYDNPQAGVIYKRLGFTDIGSWTMTYLDK